MNLPQWLTREFWRARIIGSLDAVAREEVESLEDTIKALSRKVDRLNAIVPAYGFMAGFDISLADRGGSRLIGHTFPDEIIRRRTLVCFEGAAPVGIREATYEEMFGDSADDYAQDWHDFNDDVSLSMSLRGRTMKRSPMVCANDLAVEYGDAGWQTLPITEIRPIVELVYRKVVTRAMEEMPFYEFEKALVRSKGVGLERTTYFGGSKGDLSEAEIHRLLYNGMTAACVRARRHMEDVLLSSEFEVRARREGIRKTDGSDEISYIGKKHYDQRDKLFAEELNRTLWRQDEIGFIEADERFSQ